MTVQQNNTTKVDERIFTLSRPFTFEEKPYTELLLDFDALTGADLIKVENNYAETEKRPAYVKALALPYQLHLAAAAAKVPVIFFDKLPAKDVSKIGLLAQSFLLV